MKFPKSLNPLFYKGSRFTDFPLTDARVQFPPSPPLSLSRSYGRKRAQVTTLVTTCVTKSERVMKSCREFFEGKKPQFLDRCGCGHPNPVPGNSEAVA